MQSYTYKSLNYLSLSGSVFLSASLSVCVSQSLGLSVALSVSISYIRMHTFIHLHGFRGAFQQIKADDAYGEWGGGGERPERLSIIIIRHGYCSCRWVTARVYLRRVE